MPQDTFDDDRTSASEAAWRSRALLTLTRRIVGLIVCWFAAILVALNDIDFFNPDDFFDLRALHHEQIFGILVVLGFVLALTPSKYFHASVESGCFHGAWIVGGLLAYLSAAALFLPNLQGYSPTRFGLGLAFLAVVLALDVVSLLLSHAARWRVESGPG